MKRIFLILGIFFSVTFCFAQEVERPLSQSLTVSGGLNTMHGFSPAMYSISSVYGIKYGQFESSDGFEWYFGNYQITLSGLYWFFETPKTKIGAGLIYNFDWLVHFSMTNNILAGAYFEWNPKSWYAMNLNVDYYLKLRDIFAISDTKPCLVNNSIAFVFRNDFYLPKNFTLNLAISSIDFFRYMILCMPSFVMGVTYITPFDLDLYFEAVIHYVDFFTISAHYEDTEFHLGVKYKW